jgi:hypothetical protein
MTIILRRVLLVAVIAISGGPAVWGQAAATRAQDEVFKKGIDALDEEEWADAVKYFQEAIKLDSKESTRKIGGRFGLGGDWYLPHVRLGQAFVGLGDCASAFKAWEEAERQGVVKSSEDGHEIVEEGSEECQEKGFLPSAEFAPQEQKAAALLRDAAEIDTDIAAARIATPQAATVEMLAAYERGRSELGAARAKLDEARRTRRAQAMTDALAAAEGAKGSLTSTRRAFEKIAESNAERTNRVRASAGEVDAIIEVASRAAQGIAASLASWPGALTLPPETTQERQRAQTSLDGAREKVAAARQSGAERELVEARQLAALAQAGFGRVQEDIDRLRAAAVEGELARLRSDAAQAFDAASARVSTTQKMLTTPGRGTTSGARGGDPAARAGAELASARGRLDTARREFDKAASSGDLTAARAAARTVVAVNDSLDAMSPLVGGAAVTPVIPDALKAAAEAHFAGRYEQVATLLTSEVLQSMSTSLRVHAHTLRAASYFARYEYSNRRDQSLRDAARTDADASRRLDPAFQPDPAAFAPKFLTFYSDTARAGR